MISMISGFVFVFSHPLNKNHFWKTLFRVIWWKFNQLIFKLPVAVPIADNIICLCHPHLSYSGLIVYTTWPDYAEWYFLRQFLHSKSVFIDVGAHSGDYSLLAASKISNGSIYAFEPDPRILPHLKQNIDINRLGKIVSIMPIGISDTKGTQSFSTSFHSETSHLTTKTELQTTKIKILTTSLDLFARDQKLSAIDVLKIDVEGAEGLVLAGAKKLLSQQKIAVILFELNTHIEQYGSSTQQILQELQQKGYRIFSFTDKLKLQPVSEHQHINDTTNLIAFNQKTLNNELVKKYLI